MNTLITRKEYDSNGSETSALGIPCTSITEDWDGSISYNGGSIDDVYDVSEIDIDELTSGSGKVALVAEIEKVKMQKRCIPTSFTKPVIKGYPVNADGSVNFDAGIQTDTLTEIPLSSPIYVNGILVYKLWQCSGNTSFAIIESNVLMDKRNTMVGYGVDDADKCIYRVLNASCASQIGPLTSKTISDGVQIDAETGSFDNYYAVNNAKNIVISFNAKKAIDSLCGLVLTKINKDGCCPNWMKGILEQGFSEIHSIFANNPSIADYLSGNKEPDTEYPLLGTEQITVDNFTTTKNTSIECVWKVIDIFYAVNQRIIQSGAQKDGGMHMIIVSKTEFRTIFNNSTKLKFALPTVNTDIVSTVNQASFNHVYNGATKTGTSETFSGHELTCGGVEDIYGMRCITTKEGYTVNHRIYALSSNVYYDIITKKLYDLR